MLPSLAQDKANHFVYGAIIFAAVFAVVWALFPPHALWAAGGGVVLAAVVKEVYDRLSKKGEPSRRDAWATVAGGVVASIPFVVSAWSFR